jgi:hypothetical protein
MLLLRQKTNWGAGRSTEREQHRSPLARKPDVFELGYEPQRSEALTSKPGIGDKVRSVLEGFRSRLAVDAVETPATPALLDYPYRS